MVDSRKCRGWGWVQHAGFGADNSELKGHGVGVKGLKLRVGLKTSRLRLRLYGTPTP